jgi:cytochrome P450/NADPH-cytochrome P450 reductase
LLELLERFPSARPATAELLALWPALATRRYSISSSPAHAPGRCALTVSVLDARERDGRRHRGTATSYLARRQPGDLLAVAVETGPARFRLPDDPRLPLIMLCAGSGVAPFRAYVQERLALHANGAGLGTALLYFGCDRRDSDFLYRDELEGAEALGVVQLRPTFCQSPEDDQLFVQHRLWSEREQVARLLRAGAHVRVCGDAQLFAPAVRDVLSRIIGEQTPALPTLDELEQQGRYAADVFG